MNITPVATNHSETNKNRERFERPEQRCKKACRYGMPRRASRCVGRDDLWHPAFTRLHQSSPLDRLLLASLRAARWILLSTGYLVKAKARVSVCSWVPGRRCKEDGREKQINTVRPASDQPQGGSVTDVLPSSALWRSRQKRC